MQRRLQRAGEARPQAIRGEEIYRISRPPKTKHSKTIREESKQTRLDEAI